MDTQELVRVGLRGQAALAVGFMLVDPYEQLRCGEMQKLEDQLRLTKAYAEIAARFPARTNVAIKQMTDWCVHYEYTARLFRWFGWQLCAQTDVLQDHGGMQVVVQREPLVDYAREPIPPSVLARIDEAVAIGYRIEDMEVCYPITQARRLADPIVIINTKAGSLLVGQWG